MLTALKLASGLLISSKKRENHIEQKFSIVGNNENVPNPQLDFTLFNIGHGTKLCTFCVVTLMYTPVL